MELDWFGVINPASGASRLMEQLETIPRSCWTQTGPFGLSLLHYSCQGNNVDATAALLVHGLNADASTSSGWTAVHFAVTNKNARALELLCAAGASLRIATRQGAAPLDMALKYSPAECAPVLLANGVRLTTADKDHRQYITSDLVTLEYGILRCRAAVAAMLRIKRVGAARMVRWDRFLVAHLACQVWATRCEKQWQA